MVMENGDAFLRMPNEEKEIIVNLASEAERDLKEGDVFYVISARWFSRWETYVGKTSEERSTRRPVDYEGAHVDMDSMFDRPGSINNTDILDDSPNSLSKDPELARTLLEGRDYVLVPQNVWEKLLEWYKGGPALPRKLISQGIYRKEFQVEVYRLRLRFIDSRDNSEFTVALSRKARIQELYDVVCEIRGIRQDKVCLWDFYSKIKHSRLLAMDRTLEESELHMDQEVLLEVHDDGYFPSELKNAVTRNDLSLLVTDPPSSSKTIAGGPFLSNGHLDNGSLNLSPQGHLIPAFNGADSRFSVNTADKKEDTQGLAGLQNLGNTCFMNSALQCLLHTLPLVKYFLQDYSKEINEENPLGMHGELAYAFGDLLRKVWSAGQYAVAPRAFKAKLASFAPQFSGYNQHDSHELLAFLLDGLHEDLNRVKKKPYIETKDWNGRPDEEVAEECWRNHKARNDSVIVDICHGQYKSTLVCPECNKVSITFDPMMHLTLPLHSTVMRTMNVTVFSGDGTALPMPYTVLVLKHGHCRDLSHALANACCLRSDECLLLSEVYHHKIYRILENQYEPLGSIKDEDHIVAYRLRGKGTGKRILEIVHQEKSPSNIMKGGFFNFFGTPLLAYIDAGALSGADIIMTTFKLLAPFRKLASSTPQISKESDLTSIPLSEGDQCGDDITLMDDQSDHPPFTGSEFQLLLASDQCSSCNPVTKDTVIKPGKRLKVVLQWTENERLLYDHSQLTDLPDVYHRTGFGAKKTRQEAISLFSCLDAFLTEEHLGPDDMWYCPGCKEHREAIKKLDLWKLPEILVFHLKRFSNSRYFTNKLDTFVDFPIHNLDLSKYVKGSGGESYVYDLYAVSNHYGGLGSGHYTAFAKLVDNHMWYNFNDSHVYPVNEAEIKTSAAYLLFYQRTRRGERDTAMDANSYDPS